MASFTLLNYKNAKVNLVVNTFKVQFFGLFYVITNVGTEMLGM